jgi:hypothetical protein
MIYIGIVGYRQLKICYISENPLVFQRVPPTPQKHVPNLLFNAVLKEILEDTY